MAKPKVDRDKLGMMFEKFHEAASKRHGGIAYLAHRAAVNAITELQQDPSDPLIKTLVSMVVLRVLDATQPTKKKEESASDGNEEKNHQPK